MIDPNRFKGRCFRCGGWVAAETGYCRPWDSDLGRIWFPTGHQVKSFLIEHRECHEKYKGTAVHHIWNPVAKS